MDKLNSDQLRSIFENLSEGIIIHDGDTSIKYYNDSALRILDLTKETLLDVDANSPQWFFVDENFKKIEIDDYPVSKVIRDKRKIKNEVMGVKNIYTNDLIWVQLNGTPMFKDNGEVNEVIISFADITRQKKALQLLYKQTYFNPISSLKNRASLSEFMENTHNDYVTVYIDILNFDKLHEYFGTKLAHEMISFTALKLQEKISKKDHIFHLEISNFVLLLELSSDNMFLNIKNMVAMLNKSELYFEKLNLHLQIVCGVSFKSNDALLTAQMALNEAKKNQTVVEQYSHISNKVLELNQEIFWSQSLRFAINNNCIHPQFQPIIDNQTGKINKYEVLMRIKIDDQIYYPNTFLDIAKDIKLYRYLTMELINKVFNYFNNKDIQFSINLNTEDLTSKTITDYLLAKIQDFHTPSNITIEVVESESINDFETINRFFNTVKIYGVKIAIDDFGSGYSNFEYILKLDADYIKIDGSLIKDIDINKDSYQIVETIVGFAKLKDIKVIAEFVSSEAIYKSVKELGIDYSQGFYFGKPDNEIDISKDHIDEKNSDDKKINKEVFKQLIYASRVKDNVDFKSVEQIFKNSALKNKVNGISGYIVYDGKYFLQIIEGESKKVNQLYENIVNDTRHTDFYLIGFKQISKRAFKSWNLGYIDNDRKILDFLHKTTNEKVFLPYQFDYDKAFEFLEGINKIL